MLEFVLRNQDNIILGLVFLLLGAAIGPLLSSLFSKKEHSQRPPVTLSQIVQIDNSSRVTNNYYSGGVHSEDPAPAVSIAVVACCFGYLYWRQEILLTLTSISLFSIGLFLGTAIYAYAKDMIDGAGWTVYLIFSCVVAVLSFVLIASALKPTYAPAGLDAFQSILRQQKLGGLIRVMTLDSTTWLMTHVTGVFLLFIMQIRLSLSLGHYLALVDLSSAMTPRSLSSWFAVRTKKYKNPLWNGFVLSVMYVASYVLINGYAYVWYSQLFSHT